MKLGDKVVKKGQTRVGEIVEIIRDNPKGIPDYAWVRFQDEDDGGDWSEDAYLTELIPAAMAPQGGDK